MNIYIICAVRHGKPTRVCWSCGEPRPKLDPKTGRYGCFFCAPVRLPGRKHW